VTVPIVKGPFLRVAEHIVGFGASLKRSTPRRLRDAIGVIGRRRLAVRAF